MKNNDALLLFLGVSFLVIGVKRMTSSLAVKNNNPLNIEFSTRNDWLGQVGLGDDGRFAKFVSPVYGFRAAMKILNAYNRRGINTIESIIETWAPAFENPHQKEYINFVSKRMGLLPKNVITKEDYPKLVSAMARFESGQEWENNHIMQAFSMV